METPYSVATEIFYPKQENIVYAKHLMCPESDRVVKLQ